MSFSSRNYRSIIAGLAAATLAGLSACGGDSSTGPTPPTGFLAGTSDNRQIGVVVNSTGHALTMFQLGSPTTQEQIPLGASSTITPTGLAVRGRRAVVPLGDAGSLALIDLQAATITRYFTFESGNATGAVFADDTTIIASNLLTGAVARFTVGQGSDASTVITPVAPQPGAITVVGNRALVLSANLDANYQPIGNGILTALDTRTLAVLGTATMGGANSTAQALGPDGLLYVLNTGDYVAPSSMTIVNPTTMQIVANVPGLIAGAGAISIDANGLAYISSFGVGTVVWNTKTRAFVRGPDDPLCAKAAGVCRGAAAATADASGNLYQLFFGSGSLPPYAFVYKAGTFALTDSVAVGTGPSDIAIRSF